MTNNDEHAEQILGDAMRPVDASYRDRGIFQDRFGFGARPAVVVVDFANGWTDEGYAGGSQRLNEPVENTRKLLDAARPRDVPVVYTTTLQETIDYLTAPTTG